MNKLKILILLFYSFYAKTGHSQDVPLSQRLIEEGYRYLSGDSHQGTPKDARQSFNKVRLLYFFNKTVVIRANLGLSQYYLVTEDTLESIKILRNVIGKKTCRRIEKSDFSKLQKTKNDDWNTYYSTTGIIEIFLEQRRYGLAKNYLKYLKEYVEVKWTCGSGFFGAQDFIDQVEATLSKNGR